MSIILGINAYHAGAAAALVVDGQPVVAIAEERLNRVKHHAGFPARAIRCCLDYAGLTYSDLDAVALGRDRSANLARKLAYAARNPARLLNLARLRSARSALDDVTDSVSRHCGVDRSALRFEQHNVEHHLAHTASAYFMSPWEHATGLTVDGSGDFATCLMTECTGAEIRVRRRIHVPQSLGSLYTMVSEFIGYDRYGDEGKVMGLAPFGDDVYRDTFADMIETTSTGMRLNPRYFMPFGSNQGVSITRDGRMSLARHYTDEMVRRFGPPRRRGAEITRRDRNLAFGLQARFEDVYLHLLRLANRLAPSDRVCLAGGCALNSVANGKIFHDTPFREAVIQPGSGDEGLALGAALYVSNSVKKEGHRWVMSRASLGPEYSREAMMRALTDRGVAWRELDRDELVDETAGEIERGRVVGWFQGRSEWGPRALGNRSILAHPGLPAMKSVLNARVKHREPFRPFAPAILAERQSAVFEHDHPSPFMQHVYRIRPRWRERLCAVNHVDDTGRLQTVTREANPLYYDLIRAFEARTGIPAVLNTSFNENEPIVEQPAEAVDCFLRTKMDVLVLGPFCCRKEDP